MTYQVEQTYVDHVQGKSTVRVLPKVYKTWQGANRAAQRLSYVVIPPDGRITGGPIRAPFLTRSEHQQNICVCTSTAKVVEKVRR